MAEIVQFEQCGGPEVLKRKSGEIPVPVADEVILKVKAFSLNQAELLYLKGEHTTKNKFPSRIGSEATGVVIAIGPKVKDVEIGDRVSTLPFMTNEFGVQGESADVPVFALLSIPVRLSFDQQPSI